MEFERIFEEDESMENANSQFAALTLEELPHTDPRPKRFGEPMEEELYALKRLRISEWDSMPEQCHYTPQKELAGAPETDPQEPEQVDGPRPELDDEDDQDSMVASDDYTTQKGDDISEWLVNFLNAVLDDNEDDEGPSMTFKEKRRQFRRKVNKCLDEALGTGNDDDVVSSDPEVSDEDDDAFPDEDDDILIDEDDEEVSALSGFSGPMGKSMVP